MTMNVMFKNPESLPDILLNPFERHDLVHHALKTWNFTWYSLESIWAPWPGPSCLKILKFYLKLYLIFSWINLSAMTCMVHHALKTWHYTWYSPESIWAPWPGSSCSKNPEILPDILLNPLERHDLVHHAGVSRDLWCSHVQKSWHRKTLTRISLYVTQIEENRRIF